MVQTSTEQNKSDVVRLNKDIMARLRTLNPNINIAITLLFDKVNKGSISIDDIREVIKEEILNARGT